MYLDLSSNFYAMILGALIILGLYHFLMFLQNKKKLYLYYSLYALTFSVYLLERLPEDPFNLHLINPSIQFLTFAFYVLFARHLLETKEQNKLLDAILKYAKNFLYGLTILFLVLHVVYPHEVQLKIYFYVIPVFIVICILIYGLIFRIKGPDVFYFLVGSLIYFALAIVSFVSTPTSGVISEAYLYKQGIHPLLPMYVGVMIENLVFAVLVGNKTKRIEIEKITAEKNREIAEQKNTTLLKEQELRSIDAMIEGQELERKKVADELHDDLGSLLATIKLHFEYIKKGTNTTYDQVEILLDEAYQKIRGIAHTKNAGVIAHQGLLPALTKMANAVNATNAIKIEISEFGLDQKIQNSLELSIFRIIQELMANAIKHAKATKLSIQLTQHQDTLNIIVEDNGQGFKASKNTINNGIGLHNIEKRIENLEGHFTIDSLLGKGTTILIDLPL